VRVHRNLHKARAGGPQWVSTVRGRVDEYLDEVVLMNVTTRIQPGGLAKCKKRQRRDVCAYLDGDRGHRVDDGHEWQRVAFDPRCDANFLADGRPWNVADMAHLRCDGSALVLNPRWIDAR